MNATQLNLFADSNQKVNFNGFLIERKDLLIEVKEREKLMNESKTDEVLCIGDKILWDGKTWTLNKFKIEVSILDDDVLWDVVYVFKNKDTTRNIRSDIFMFQIDTFRITPKSPADFVFTMNNNDYGMMILD